MKLEAPPPLAFDVDPKEFTRDYRAYTSAANPAARYAPIGIGILAVSQFVGVAAQAHLGAKTVTLYLIAATIAFAALFFASYRLQVALRARRQPKHIAVDFAQFGIGLQRDADVQRVTWYAIKEAYDLRTAIAITRRDDRANPIIIPKRALADDGAAKLWSYLEERLTGTRPTIRDLGFTAPKRLTNSIDQFVVDGAAS